MKPVVWTSFLTEYTVCLSGMLCSASKLLCLPSAQAEWKRRVWKGNRCVSCKESVWTLGATHETLSSGWFFFVPSAASCLWTGGLKHIQLSASPFGYRGTCAWYQVENPKTVTMILPPCYYFSQFFFGGGRIESLCCFSVWHCCWDRCNNANIFTLPKWNLFGKKLYYKTSFLRNI